MYTCKESARLIHPSSLSVRSILRTRQFDNLCEVVSSEDSATAAEEDTELMAPVSCDALSSSDRAVCN